MSVSNVGSAAGLSQLQWRSSVRQARQDFEQLFQDMQSGDLSGAQQAYSALQQLLPGSSTSSGTSTASADATAPSAASVAASSTTGTATGTGATGNTIASDWSALGQALQSGNLSSAQSAFSQLEQDLQSSAQGAGHRHHHHEVEQAQAVYSAMQIGNANSTAGTATGNSANPIASDISALKQALQSGDTTSAQNLLTQLQSDLQASGQAQGFSDHRHHRGFAMQSPTAAYAGGSSAVTPTASTADTASTTTTTA